MAASVEDWSCDSNKAVRVSLVRPDPSTSGLKVIHQFHPQFTYPIFGEEERIFGYQELDIEVRFAAHNCQPHVVMSYDKKFAAVGDVRAMDCWGILKEFMPPPAFENNFEEELREDIRAQTWTPPGQKIHSYERDSRSFEVWGGSLSDVNTRHQLDQIQIFILFFIEGGTLLQLDDVDWTLDRWNVYFLYEKTQVPDEPNISPYVLAGYTTNYRYWTFTTPTARPTTTSITSISDLEEISLTHQDCRLRIAQFVILPPFQASGHGSELYQTIYRLVMGDKTIKELTVEDPSEEFDRLRDLNDWKVLEPAFKAANVKLNTAAVAAQSRFHKMPKTRLLDLKQLETMRKQHKMSTRQFYRSMELYFLSQIPYSHRAAGGASLTKLLIRKHKTPDPIDAAYYWLRNIIKARIWRQNYDKIHLVERTEAIDAINDTLRGQEDEYEGYLLRFAAKAAGELNGNSFAAASSAGGVARKRKIIDDDDDDDGAVSDASKKARSSK